MTTSSNRNVPFQEIIESLLDTSKPFPPAMLHRFSDIGAEDFLQLKEVWHRVPGHRRASLLQDLETIMEGDTLVSYDELARFALDDEDPEVRQGAIRLLWETEDPHLVPKLLDLLDRDENLQVRAIAANALGKYVYLGELEEIPNSLLHTIEDGLINALLYGESDLIRRSALESLGYSSRAEVAPEITRAFNHDDPSWIASALFAMGRSLDQAWKPYVLESLDHPEEVVRIEAIRAAGNLELKAARKVLIDLLEEGVEDEEVRATAIWALSQIGGSNVKSILENMLEQAGDDEEADIIEQALDNLLFNEGLGDFTIFDIDTPEEDDEEYEEGEDELDIFAGEEDEEE